MGKWHEFDLEYELLEYLNGRWEWDLVALHNQYVENVGRGDIIFDRETFFSDTSMTVLDVINNLSEIFVPANVPYFFNPHHEYVKFSDSGYIISSNKPRYDWIDTDDMVDYIIENNDDLGDNCIRDLLDGVWPFKIDEDDEEEN